MRNLISILMAMVLCSAASANSVVTKSASEKLRMYQASSAKFDQSIVDAKYGVAGTKHVLVTKQMVDNFISATVIAKDCDALLAASPTLRPGKYTVYPEGTVNKPSEVICNPMSTAKLILLLNSSDD